MRGAWIEAACRFVEQEQLGIMKQHAGQRESLLHAARQAIDLEIDLVREICELEHVIDDRLPLVRRKTIRRSEEVQVLPRRQVFIHAEEVGHIADLLADRRRPPPHVESGDLHHTVKLSLQSRQDADRR